MWGEIASKVYKDFQKAGLGEVIITLVAGPNDLSFSTNPPVAVVSFYRNKLDEKQICEHIKNNWYRGSYITSNTPREKRAFRFKLDKDTHGFLSRKGEGPNEETAWLLILPTEEWRDYYSYLHIPVLVVKNTSREIVVTLTPAYPNRLEENKSRIKELNGNN